MWLTIALANLTVTDPDNVDPTDFTISVKSGSNYKVSGVTIRPASGFTGTLKVLVTVNGGSADCNARSAACVHCKELGKG